MTLLEKYAVFSSPPLGDSPLSAGELKDATQHAFDQRTGELYEVVQVAKNELSPQKMAEINQELAFGKRLQACSNNLRLLLDVVVGTDGASLIYTSSRGVRSPGSRNEIPLLEYVMKSGKLAEEEAKIIFAQIAQLVLSCHQNLVVLRDLKLPSILIDPTTKVVRLTHFFQASQLESQDQLLADRKGSPAYVSPDVLIGKPFSGQKADVWGLGVVLYALLCGNFPFVGPSAKEIFQKILTSHPVYPSHLSPQACALLQGLLKQNPYSRLSVAEALNHPWLSQEIDDEDQVVPDF